MPHVVEPLRVVSLAAEIRKQSGIGAEVILPPSMKHLDLDGLSDEEKATLRASLFDHGVLVVRNQQGLDPQVMPKVGRFFDETAWDIHSGGEKMVTDAKNILSQNRGARVPRAPQVSIIGKGNWTGYEGLPDLDLKHVSHTEFHETPCTTEELEDGFTRPYRWHMDAPLYERLPGYVTSLHSLKNPDLPDQKLRFTTGEVLPIPAGATAFYSGARAFDILSDEEKEFALNTTVQYAPRAYEWMLDCKAREDGLTIAKSGKEKRLKDLPEWSWNKVHAFPAGISADGFNTAKMVWRNHGNGRPHLQVLGCCAYSLRTTDPVTGEVTVMDDLDEVRRVCHKLTSKVYAPENIYAHRWQEGDLVIFHNRGVLHSITGELTRSSGESDPERRLFWQCTMSSGTVPVAYRSAA
ncbi:sulfonate dioxygenase [Apiospora phragmitis]|uniref:Sulfonate dioxygenase n=1 Tax=Apiospora phragmitis TaxID=2905665 RepID=A0ABR1SXA3_9PEZI